MAVPEVISATTIEGDKIVNEKGEDLGNIKDIMIDLKDGSVSYVVLSFGGFLGLGDKLFGVPWKAIHKDPGAHNFILNVDKEKLENAPGFDKDNWPGTTDESHREYVTTIYDYYGYEQPSLRRGSMEETRTRSLEEPVVMSGNEYEAGARSRSDKDEPATMGAEETMAASRQGEIIGAGTTAGMASERTTEVKEGSITRESYPNTHREIYQILKDEHDKVLSMFDEAIRNGSRDTFMQIKDELDTHLNGEEELLYPVLKGENRTHDITMEGYQEHHVAKVLLSELDSMSEKDEMWISKLKVLKENVKHHVEEEEKDMFPASRNVLSEQKAEELAEQYLAFKDKYRAAHGRR
ncbi:PRC-barrel domain-containing protein [Methanolobus sp.]|uniref:PRC-barrel domain-containing protein n=1 Tax=Methanolobus sp. TaxID=1874737 RepID=UPI0025F610F2|nr:PRC-barrel domain-containing protein [Methanolobus sp.]